MLTLCSLHFLPEMCRRAESCWKGMLLLRECKCAREHTWPNDRFPFLFFCSNCSRFVYIINIPLVYLCSYSKTLENILLWKCYIILYNLFLGNFFCNFKISFSYICGVICHSASVEVGDNLQDLVLPLPFLWVPGNELTRLGYKCLCPLTCIALLRKFLQYLSEN